MSGEKKSFVSDTGMKVIIGCAVAALVGLGLWIYQANAGLALTNMRNLESWGLYITNFMFFIGLSAGGLIISSVPRVFGVAGFGGISKIAVWTSLCCTILAALFVAIDLGQPLRLWELIVYSNLSSPLMWDIIVITTYLILSAIYLIMTIRSEAGKCSARALRVISTIALVTAVLVHSVTAWIFALQNGREMWHTALMAPWFVSSALVSGLALVMVVVIVLRKIGYLELGEGHLVKMGKFLGTFCCIDLYFFGCDLLTEGFPGGSGAELVYMMVAGPLAPFFWTEVIGCVLAAVICFVPALRKPSLFAVAGAASILAIFCKRCQIILGGFTPKNIDVVTAAPTYPLTDIGSQVMGAFPSLVYFPTFIEMGIVLCAILFGLGLLTAGLKFLPLKPAK